MITCRSLRPDDPHDLAACVALLQRGHDARFTAERFRWLHEQAPGGRSRVAVGEDDGRVIALSAIIPRPAMLHGRPILAGRDVDPVVDPDYRGRGLFSQLLRWLLAHLDGVELLYNFANPGSAPGFLRSGWREAGQLADSVVQLGHRRPLTREHLLHLATYPRAARRTNGQIVELTAADLATLPGLPAAPPDRAFAVLRTPAHLVWRYGRCPLRSYRYFLHRQDGAAATLAVVRHVPEARRLIVMDVAAFAPGGGALGPFLPAWRAAFGPCWTGVWTGVPGIWRRGFVSRPGARGQRVLVRAAPGREDLIPRDFTARAMFLTHGDVEAS